MSKVQVQSVKFHGLDNCIELSNGHVKCIVTTDIGPRVAFWGFIDGMNEFYVSEEDISRRNDKKYHAFAGHRMWHGPQIEPRCCMPDNDPVAWEVTEDKKIILTEKTELETHIQKIMEVQLAEDLSEVTVTHRMINHGLWAVDLTVWALTMMSPGGVEVIPFSNRKTDLLHNRTISLWPWTDMGDYRIRWGKQAVFLQQDEQAPAVIPEQGYKNAVKIGTNADSGCIGYFNHGHLFIKKFTPVLGAIYPDGGCSCETYTDSHMLEMESLSPMVRLEPERETVHVEKWVLFDHIRRPDTEDEAISVLNEYAGKGGK